MNILENLKNYFDSDVTKDVEFRIQQLKNLKTVFKKFEPQIFKALKVDLKKPDLEIYLMEFGPVIEEIDYAISNLKKWARPEKVSIPFYLKPNEGFIYKEPFGTVLIINAFNYPFQLEFCPLIGAIAAGNCAVVKTSRLNKESSKIIKAIIEETFSENYVTCLNDVEGSSLTNLKFDYIFFTGNPKTGSLIAQEAAKNLVPYTLELGGKSPCIVEKSANLKAAARKIAWGKFVNAGQTCIAPDYVLVQKEIKEEFLEEIKTAIKEFFGPVTQESKDFGRIINTNSFLRLKNLIDYDKLIYGGSTDECGLYIEPAIVRADSFEEPVMQEEIFGPILPVMEFETTDKIIEILKKREKPLALYVFSQDEKITQNIINSLSFGGGAVNETLAHAVSLEMPFGGVGMSGIGRYHGKFSFDTFTHQKSILINRQKNPSLKMLPPYDFEEIKKLRNFIG